MASISATGVQGNHTFSLTVTESSTNTTANNSTLSYSLTITPKHSSYQWNGEGTNISYSVVINGTTVKSGYIPDYDGTTKSIASGTTTVTHNTNGAKSINYSFSIVDRDGESYTCGSASANGALTLTDFCVITYNANGGSGTMADTRYVYTTSGTTSLRANGFTRTGYTFLGWSLSSTATSASYSNSQAWGLSNNGDYTLYAVWKLNTYKLSISAGTGSTITAKKGSTVLSNGATISHGDSLTIAFGAEPGYELETHTVNGTSFTSGNTHTVTANVTVIATAKMLGAVYIDHGTTIEKYLVFVDTGTGWLQYVPYIDDGSEWHMCS